MDKKIKILQLKQLQAHGGVKIFEVGSMQCDQIGRFWKVHGNKGGPNIWSLLGAILKIFTFRSNLMWLLLGANSETNRATFIPTSGHNGSMDD